MKSYERRLLHPVVVWLLRHGRSLSLYGGLVMVTLWTVIRHLTNGTNYDVVGQVGVAEQWAHGLHDGAQFGPTNYLLKMPFYALVNVLGFLGPHGRLLLLALACNLLTYAGLFWLAGRLLDLYGIRSRHWAYLGMLWLATISGSVFWLDYANSRNLETVGGIFVLYLVLKYLVRPPNPKQLLLVATVTGLVLFADTLQVFAIILPVCVYLLVRAARRRQPGFSQPELPLLGALVAGYIGSKVLFLTAHYFLPVSFLAAPTPIPKFTLPTIIAILKACGLGTLKIFDAYFYRPPLGPNAVREFANAIILLAIGTVLVRSFRRASEKLPNYLFLLVLLASYGAFAASGQALQWETQRYLIMVPIVAVIYFGLIADPILAGIRKPAASAAIAAISLSCLLLVGAGAIAWGQRYSKDIFIADSVSYLAAHDYTLAVSSREVGIPATYFSSGQRTVLPVVCGRDHRLHISDLFYDRAAFTRLKTARGDVPVIVQPQGIRLDNTYCYRQDIIKQFGQPLAEQTVPGVGVAEIYPAAKLQLTE